jgi:dihydrolipoamide dehydrogenase
VSLTEVRVPDLGDFDQVDVIEVHFAPGATVGLEDPLITLETDKATMDVPSPAAGVVTESFVAVGDKVASGDRLLTLEAVDSQPAPTASTAPRNPEPVPAAAAVAVASSEFSGKVDRSTGLLVLGAGPGGYTAAFRAADLGLEVTLVERWDALGGVCLNVGCIPSKALLHAARVIEEAADMSACGVTFGAPQIDSAGLRDWKNRVVGRLTGGLTALARQRKVAVVHGQGSFLSPHHLQVRRGDETEVIRFDQCIIAAGSEAAALPGLPTDERIMDSTAALELAELPDSMLVIGGGIIGLEMATVYDALGVNVTIVELTDTLMPGCDRDLVRPLEKRLRKRYSDIMLSTGVVGIEARADGLMVSFEGSKAPPEPMLFGRVLVAVGRRANGHRIGADQAGVAVSDRGLIAVDKQMRTNVQHIFAIGDIVGEPMLAHKATHEGKVAAEVAAGHKRAFDARVIPSVAYTDPEVAWVGLTETAARAQGIEVGKGVFPWAASGRSLALNRDEGFTKLLFDKDSGRLLGAGIVGTSAGDLIAEAALAIEMGADAADIGLTIHPHPTLSETVGMAAEAFEGSLTDLYLPKR